MSEYKTARYLLEQQKFLKELPEFCRHCPEHTREHGDCVDAGDPLTAVNCPRVEREIERRLEPNLIMGVEQL